MTAKPHPFIGDAMKAADGLWSNPKHFRALHRVRWSRSKAFTGAERRHAPCGRRRSERREIHARLLKALVYRMDLLTLRVGTPMANGRCAGITVETLAGWIGASIWRTERALGDFYLAGYVSSDQPRRRAADGRYVGLPSVRALSTGLFEVLGMRVKLAILRRRIYKQRQTARRAADPARGPEARAEEAAASVNDSRRFFAELARLHQDPEMKGRPHADLVELAHERMRGPPGSGPPSSST